jgi:hypothetical protein
MYYDILIKCWAYDNWIFNYLCSPVSSTNKTDGHDIHVHVTEILLKVVLNTMTLTLHTPQHSQSCKGQSVYLCFLSECYIFYTCLDLTLYKYILLFSSISPCHRSNVTSQIIWYEGNEKTSQVQHWRSFCWNGP